MMIKLNQRAFQHAKHLITRRRFVLDKGDAWSEHRPTSRRQDAFVAVHGIRSYSTWFLGIDEEAPEGSKARHKFPYGDFENVHRCAVVSAELRAARYRYRAIESAAAQIRALLEERAETRQRLAG